MAERVVFALWILATAGIARGIDYLFSLGTGLSIAAALGITLGLPLLFLFLPRGAGAGPYDEALKLLGEVTGWLEHNAAAAKAVAGMPGTEASGLAFQTRNRKLSEAAARGEVVDLDVEALVMAVAAVSKRKGSPADAVLYLTALEFVSVAFYVSEKAYAQHLDKYQSFVSRVARLLSKCPEVVPQAVRKTLEAIAEDLKDSGNPALATTLARALQGQQARPARGARKPGDPPPK